MAYGTGAMDVVQSSTTGTPTQFQDGSGTQIGTLCRAWVNFVGASGARNASFNVSSVTRNSSGNYTINYANAMPDANFSLQSLIYNSGAAFGSSAVGVVFSKSNTTTASTILTGYSVSGNLLTANDYDAVFVAVFR